MSIRSTCRCTGSRGGDRRCSGATGSHCRGALRSVRIECAGSGAGGRPGSDGLPGSTGGRRTRGW